MIRSVVLILLAALLTQNGCAALEGYRPTATDRPFPPALRARNERLDGSIDLSGHDASAPLPTRTISLAEVIARAREDSAAVLEAAANLDAASGRVQTATGPLLPGAALVVGGSSLNGRQVGSFGKEKDVAFGRFEPSASIFYRVNPGFSLARASRFAHEAEAAALAVQDAARTAALQAAVGYFDIALARASVQIAGELVRASERFVGITQARAQAEIVSVADVFRAEADAARARQALIQAHAQWERASVRLAVLVRWPPNELLIPSEQEMRPRALVDPGASAELQAEAVRARPDLRAAEARARAADRQMSAAWWDILGPEIDAGVRERFIGTEISDLGQTTLAHFFVSLSSDFGELGRLRTAQAELRASAVREQTVREQIHGEIATALSNVQAAQAALPEARTAAEATDKSYQTEVARFQAGTGLGIEVIEAQNARARAGQDLAEAILRFNAAHLELSAAVGHISPALVLPGTPAHGAMNP